MDNDDQTLLDVAHSPKRRGLWAFIHRRRTAFSLATTCGPVLICLTVFFTHWLAVQTYYCPEWAINCVVRHSVSWIKIHLPFVQGFVSTIHGIGLALLAYPAFILAEAGIWPILTYHSYTLSSVDKYLSATRGSVPGLLQAIWNIRRRESSIVMISVGLVTLLTQADRLVIGQVYTSGNVTNTYNSNYTGGGGIGLTFVQEYTPGPVPAPVTTPSNLYTSWSSNLSTEPWPEFRSFIVDRTALAQRGNFSISGLRAVNSVACLGQSINIIKDTDGVIFRVASNYPLTNSSIQLRMQPRLSVWVDQVDHVSSIRTITSLVFTSINGSIENGISTPATKKMKTSSHPIHQISGLRCTVDVSLEQATISVGEGPDNRGVNVSAVETIRGPGVHNSPHGSLGDVAQWLGSVIASLGLSIYGSQPQFVHQKGKLPGLFTTTQTNVTPEVWTQNEITEFISVASGALALSMSGQWNKAPITMNSNMSVRQLVSLRSWILLVPAVIIILIESFLATWISYTHRNSRCQEMRQANTSDMIWSTQNQSMRAGVDELGFISKGSGVLDEMKVRYGLLADGNTQMGMLWDNLEQQKLGSDLLLEEYPRYGH